MPFKQVDTDPSSGLRAYGNHEQVNLLQGTSPPHLSSSLICIHTQKATLSDEFEPIWRHYFLYYICSYFFLFIFYILFKLGCKQGSYIASNWLIASQVSLFIVWWFLVYSQELCNNHTFNFRTFSTLKKETLYPLADTTHLLPIIPALGNQKSTLCLYRFA